MKEVFLEIYRRYAGYHAQKEQLVWLPAAAYLVFVGGVIGWLGNNPGAYSGNSRWWILGFSVSICAIVVMFLWTQNLYKVHAAIITEQLDLLIPRFKGGRAPSAEELQKAIYTPKDLCRLQMRNEIWKNGKPGLLLILLTVILGVAQVLFLLRPCFIRLFSYLLAQLPPG